MFYTGELLVLSSSISRVNLNFLPTGSFVYYLERRISCKGIIVFRYAEDSPCLLGFLQSCPSNVFIFEKRSGQKVVYNCLLLYFIGRLSSFFMWYLTTLSYWWIIQLLGKFLVHTRPLRKLLLAKFQLTKQKNKNARIQKLSWLIIQPCSTIHEVMTRSV